MTNVGQDTPDRISCLPNCTSAPRPPRMNEHGVRWAWLVLAAEFDGKRHQVPRETVPAPPSYGCPCGFQTRPGQVIFRPSARAKLPFWTSACAIEKRQSAAQLNRLDSEDLGGARQRRRATSSSSEVRQPCSGRRGRAQHRPYVVTRRPSLRCRSRIKTYVLKPCGYSASIDRPGSHSISTEYLRGHPASHFALFSLQRRRYVRPT